jgi:hypothetical protein
LKREKIREIIILYYNWLIISNTGIRGIPDIQKRFIFIYFSKTKAVLKWIMHHYSKHSVICKWLYSWSKVDNSIHLSDCEKPIKGESFL